jgi:putative phage-type endonuclease
MGELILTPTDEMSYQEWLQYRKSGIGASEVGSILGLSSYTSSIEIFYEKINPIAVPKVENIYMFMGKELESFVAKMWEYWEGSEESMIENFRANKKVRECHELKAYVVNSDYPHLFVSLDRVIVSTSERRPILEIKTISGYESNKWEGGVPPSYIMQIQQQMGVYKSLEAEKALFKDGRRLEVLPFEFNPGIFETIVTRTTEFWNNVLLGREIYAAIQEAELSFNLRRVEWLTAELQQLEPSPDGSEAYQDYLKERYKIAKPGEISGTQEHFEAAVREKDFKSRIKELTEYQRKEQNFLCRELADMQVMTFGENGIVSWKTDVNGKRRFHNGIK